MATTKKSKGKKKTADPTGAARARNKLKRQTDAFVALVIEKMVHMSSEMVEGMIEEIQGDGHDHVFDVSVMSGEDMMKRPDVQDMLRDFVDSAIGAIQIIEEREGR